VVLLLVPLAGGTTTVVLRGGGEPSPLLELQAVRARTARRRAAEWIFLCDMERFLIGVKLT
jgi:hypothetical protein